MNAAASQIHDPFSIASHAAPQMLTKLTRADMSLILPRLDDSIDPAASDAKELRKKLDEKIARCVLIYRIGGHVVRSRTTKGKGDKDGIQFIGEFEARFTDEWGGKRFIAGRCHVPGSLEEMLYTQLVDAKKGDPDASIDFLVDIGTKPPNPTKASAVGYEWTVTPVVEVARVTNPVQALFDKAPPPKLALAAPGTQQRAIQDEFAEKGQAGSEAASAPTAAGKHKK